MKGHCPRVLPLLCFAPSSLSCPFILLPVDQTPHSAALFPFCTFLDVFPAINPPRILLPVSHGHLSPPKAPPRTWAGGAGGVSSSPSSLCWLLWALKEKQSSHTRCFMIYSIPSCGFSQEPTCVTGVMTLLGSARVLCRGDCEGLGGGGGGEGAEGGVT